MNSHIRDNAVHKTNTLNVTANTKNQLGNKNHRANNDVGEPDDVQPAQHKSCSDNENTENEFDDFPDMGGGK